MTDLLERDATGQLAALRSGEIGAGELMAATLDRIAARNPALNAIVSLRPPDILMAEAEAAPAGPLQGLPIAVKDLADTKDVRTTYGSPLFADHIPATDSPMVARMRAAGAVIIGKTNTPEFGLGSNSYNPVHGITRNPWDVTKSCGGSSGGAGVAVATRMLALADGSDMMGSLRNPAGWNNVLGLRPSYGLVTGGGPGEMFLSQLSTDGPMARSIRDLELLLSVQSGPDALHPHCRAPFQPGAPRHALRIGWAGDWGGAWPMEAGVLDLCRSALEQLGAAGHEICDLPPPIAAAPLWDSWTTLRSFTMAGKFRAMFDDAALRAQMKPELQWEITQGLAISGMAVHRASEIRSDWFRIFAELDIDVMALPAAQAFPFDATLDWPREIAGVAMDSYHRWMEAMIPASLIGLPALSVPAGFNQAGLPMGLQLIAKRGRDAELLELGRSYCELTEWLEKQPVPANPALA